MQLTLKRETEEIIDVDLSTPIYRKMLDAIYCKFFLQDGEPTIIRTSDGWSTEVCIRPVPSMDYNIIEKVGHWEECTEFEFQSVILGRLKKYNII